MTQDSSVAHRQVEILNALGLHLRPADKFVRLAVGFAAEIRVRSGERELDGKSILDLTSLAAERGTMLHIEAAAETRRKPSKRWLAWWPRVS